MASGSEVDDPRRMKVYMPTNVLYRLDDILELIQSRIRNGAFNRARARKNQRAERLVTQEDVLQEAREVLRSTASELDQELSDLLARHARVRNAS